MREASNLTPMLRQYRALKKANPAAILLFRMGDFYEMFYEDAKTASGLLELTLTARGKGTNNVVPMCGFPHHQLEAYTARLVRARRRVAICDQVEDPKTAKGLVRREVIRVVTPGTVTDPAQLDAKTNAWVGSVNCGADRVGAAFLDLSTGEFLAWESQPDDPRRWDDLIDRLCSFAPREIVHAESFPWTEELRRRVAPAVQTPADDYTFSTPPAVAALKRQLGVASLDGFGFRDRPVALGAAGGLLVYVQETQRCQLEHIDELQLHQPADFLLLDPATLRNLEVLRSLRDGGRRGSLVDAVDATVTPAGGRLLRRWILAPSLDVAEIAARQDAVEEFVRRADLRDAARQRLRRVLDIERLLTRTVAGSANARDLVGLRTSLENVPELLEALSEFRAPLLRRILDALDPCIDVTELLARAIVDAPPVSMKDGGVVRDGFNGELDELRALRRDGRSYIAALEARERESTGINSLKVKFNKVFGYFIEVSKPNLHLVPESYHRKQTISTGERFITPELKDYESKVLNAQERIEGLEQELFQQVRRDVSAQAARIKAVARVTARVDVLAGLAQTAVHQDYRRPRVHAGDGLRIAGGRHPVVEQFLVEQRFVPNDTELDAEGRTIAVLTGPNMGGKSTYLRQVALIVLLAQTGSFVPAESAEVGVVDRIFCRVGASDSLAEGQSTFMVEMSETANILHHATSRSLLVLDEIGRGTSTFDGLSIAWAILEHLDGLAHGTPRTLFATHYHELTELAVELGSVLNLRMAVREGGDGVVFLHVVEPGASDRSYGIHVARLAGVPQAVVARAEEILTNLERDEYGCDGLPRRARRAGSRRRAQPTLAGLFEPGPLNGPAGEVLRDLRGRDLEHLSPLEALNLLSRWQNRLRDDGEER